MPDSSDRDLLTRFSALPVEERTVLELLSVHYAPTAPTLGLKLLRHVAALHKADKLPSRAEWIRLAKRLQAEGFLEGHYSSVRCALRIVEDIARGAEREGRLPGYLQFLRELSPDMDPGRPEFGNVYQRDILFRQLRQAVYANDGETFAALDHQWYNSAWYYPDQMFNWQSRVFPEPLDVGWLRSRVPQIRNTVVYRIVWNAHYGLLPAHSLAGLLEDAATQLDHGLTLRDLAIKHALLCGSFQQAEKWLEGDTTVSGRLYQGWLCMVRGQGEAALVHFEDALAQIRGGGRRLVLLLDLPGALYVLALLGTGEAARLKAASKYVDKALRDKHNPLLHEALRCVIRLTEGKVEAAKVETGNIALELIYLEAPWDALIVYIALCLCNPDAARATLPEIKRLEERAADSGYKWLALEFHRVCQRLGPSSSGNAVDSLGTVPLMDCLGTVNPWERGLAALERIKNTTRAAGSKAGPQARLAWRVGLSGQMPQIEAVEQRLSKAGKWSKGRAVAIKRLHDRKKLDFLTPQDIQVCGTVKPDTYYGYYSSEYTFDSAAALQALVGHPSVYRLDDTAVKLEIVRAEPQLKVAAQGSVVHMQLDPEPPQSGDVLAKFQSRTRLVVTVFDNRHREIAEVLGAAGLSIPSDMSHKIGPAIQSVSSLVTVQSDLAASGIGSAETSADSTPQFLLTPVAEGLRAEPVVRPLGDDGPSFYPGKGSAAVFAYVDGKGSHARRDLAEESSRFRAATSACRSLAKSTWDGTTWSLPDPRSSLELLAELRSLGDAVKVSWPEGEKFKIQGSAAPDSLALKVRRSTDWFSVDGKVELDSGLVLTLREVLDLIDNSTGRFLQLKENEFIALTERFLQRIEDLAALVERKGKQFRFHRSRAHAIEPIMEDAGAVDSDAAWTKQLESFRESQALDPALPSTLQADLRDYQVEGVKWAARLAAWGAGACLADDMGLGKTLQALSVVLMRAPSGPSLVVAPTSVCPNWTDEARRFAPTLNCHAFGSGNRQKTLEEAGAFDVVVCSYGLLHQEADSLAGIRWSTIVLDEAQAIKNRQTMRSRAAMRLVGDFRMITTGTPIENHLGELHNLFTFINPGLLGSAESFSADFAVPVHQNDDQSAKARLKRLIQPFILRRTKSAVLHELPARTEITLRVEMSREERALYEAMRQRAIEKVEAASDSDTEGARHLKVLTEITRLRQACCHPRLVMPQCGIESSKLEAFLATVEELLENRHKALVFSQFVKHLEIVRGELDSRGIDYRYLDGSTPPKRRKQEVDAFQAGEGSLFLISLRAGGQGLNLTAADYVVHLDPWWNPAVEDQASDRAHRIGQTRPVTIYRLVMKDSIEEKIVDLHHSKRDLAENLLAGTDMSGKMSADELLGLLRET